MIQRLTWLISLFTLLLFASVFAQQRGEPRTLTGTWTCLACELKGLDGSDAKLCEDAGHKHCLRLDNGNYVYFLENERSSDILKGGRRHNVRMTVKGTYYPKAHTIDVQSYIIDGRTTAWNDVSKKMEMLPESSAKQASTETGR